MTDDRPVHFVAHFTVDDPDGYRQYEKGFFPILKQYDARFITYDDAATVLEGERPEGRTVLIEFASEAECLRWWNSPEYIELAKFRIAATTTHAIFLAHPIPSR